MIRLAKSAKPTTFLFIVFLFNYPTDPAVVKGWIAPVAKGLMPVADLMQFQQLFYTPELSGSVWHYFYHFCS
jgi:hypothetical protein